MQSETPTIDIFDAPFEWSLPYRQTAGLVLNSPHSGKMYPADFLEASILSPSRLRKSEDCFVDELFAPCVELGVPLLRASFPRAYLDLNREPYELDPAMFDGELPAFSNTTSARALAGLGTVPRIVSEYETIYRRKLSWTEANHRIETLYFPYHETLKAKLESTAEKFGHAVLIDCHSMPSSAVTNQRNSARSIDVVLGDRFGASCDEEIVGYLGDLLTDCGLNVVRNRPYAGGFITQNYGRAGGSIQSIQIELNRNLYMDERLLEPKIGFSMLQRQLSSVFTLFLEDLPNLTETFPIAAE